MARSRVLTMAVVGLLLAGCGAASASQTSAPTPSAPPTSAPPTATTAPTVAPTVVSPTPSASGTDALTVTLPSNWSVVDMNLAALQGMVNTLGSSNPQFAALINQLIASGAYKQLDSFAIEYHGLTPIGNVETTFGMPTNGLALDTFAPLLEGEVKQLGATKVTYNHVALPLGDVLLLSYDISLKIATGPVPESGRAYFYEASGELYSAVFTCTNPAKTTCLADSVAVAQTLTLAQAPTLASPEPSPSLVALLEMTATSANPSAYFTVTGRVTVMSTTTQCNSSLDGIFLSEATGQTKALKQFWGTTENTYDLAPGRWAVSMEPDNLSNCYVWTLTVLGQP